jgi:toxin ParE1/3/4
MAEYRLSPLAEHDLEAIWRYSAQEWGIDQADRYIDTLVKAFDWLKAAPRTAPACDHIRQGYRRRAVGRHMIYFRITTYGIVIVRILHDRMDIGRHL